MDVTLLAFQEKVVDMDTHTISLYQQCWIRLVSQWTKHEGQSDLVMISVKGALEILHGETFVIT